MSNVLPSEKKLSTPQLLPNRASRRTTTTFLSPPINVPVRRTTINAKTAVPIFHGSAARGFFPLKTLQFKNKSTPELPENNKPCPKDFFEEMDSLRNDLDEEADVFDYGNESISKLRRKSDTSTWSGGLGKLAKKIGFLMHESNSIRAQRVRIKDELRSKEVTKVKNVLKKTLTIRDLNKGEGERGMRRQFTVKNIKEARLFSNKTDVILTTNATLNLSKPEEDTHDIAVTLESTSGNESTKVSKQMSEPLESKLIEFRVMKKRPVVKKANTLSKTQSISKEIKTTKESILDRYIEKDRKFIEKKSYAAFSVSSLRSLKPPESGYGRCKKLSMDCSELSKNLSNSNNTSNMFEEMMLALAEPSCEKDAIYTRGSETLEGSDDAGIRCLPTIEEERRVKKERKTGGNERSLKESKVKHKTVRSFTSLPFLSPKVGSNSSIVSPLLKDKRSLLGESKVPSKARIDSLQECINVEAENKTSKPMGKESRKLKRILMKNVKTKEGFTGYKTSSLASIRI